MIDAKKTNDYVKMLMANLSFKADYHRFVNKDGGKQRLLIVEGATDEAFIKKIISTDVACIIAQKAFRRPSSFGKKPQEDFINYKAAIVQLVCGLSRFPQIISCPGSDKWIVYGMVDLDFDEAENNLFEGTKQLFVTDTHDLETLLLSTDADLLQRIKRCSIKIDDIRRAFSAAYQIGLIKMVLTDYCSGLNFSSLSAGKVEVAYAEFVEDDGKISLKRIISYMNEQSEKKLSSAKIEGMISKIKKDKRIKKYLNKDGEWDKSTESFDFSLYKDFWDVVNGHDILALLRYVNNDIAEAYKGNTKSLNREFEFDLIDNYEYKYLEKTELYHNMYLNRIVNDIE
ncbi:MAG: DUF4276 family protein [Lachnospiraceae bacterium]|nr:DUF4276 family protein [Lachnospiraceae bacterium]